jgi:hypothetical protein
MSTLLAVASACVDGPSQVDPGGRRALVAADLTVLFPVGPRDRASLWAATDAARGGSLVPRALVEELGAGALAPRYDDLRVVGLRIDPCFMHNWGTATCQPQVRLVLQPLDGTGAIGDDALHAIYNLDGAELDQLLDGLRVVAAAAPEHVGAPLGVSPALLAQGVDGAYGELLRALIITTIGPRNLARLAATAAEADGGTFVLRGLAVQAIGGVGFGPRGPLVIRPLGEGVTAQHVAVDAAARFGYDVTPAFANPIGHPAAHEATLAALDADERAGLATWLRGQDAPRIVTADSTDCAACHLVPRARRALLALAPSLAAELPAADPLPGPDVAANLRALGYVGGQPVLTARVVAETTAALAAMP